MIYIDSYENADLSLLHEPEIITLIESMIEFKDIMELCKDSLEPMHLTNYLYRLATAFHKFYSVHRVVSEDGDKTKLLLKLDDESSVETFLMKYDSNKIGGNPR